VSLDQVCAEWCMKCLTYKAAYDEGYAAARAEAAELVELLKELSVVTCDSRSGECCDDETCADRVKRRIKDSLAAALKKWEGK
jgi:hypothetical protein